MSTKKKPGGSKKTKEGKVLVHAHPRCGVVENPRGWKPPSPVFEKVDMAKNTPEQPFMPV